MHIVYDYDIVTAHNPQDLVRAVVAKINNDEGWMVNGPYVVAPTFQVVGGRTESIWSQCVVKVRQEQPYPDQRTVIVQSKDGITG